MLRLLISLGLAAATVLAGSPALAQTDALFVDSPGIADRAGTDSRAGNTEGDPDQPIITGQLPNPDADRIDADSVGDDPLAMPGVEPDEIDVKSIDDDPIVSPGEATDRIAPDTISDDPTAMQGIEPDEIDAKMMAAEGGSQSETDAPLEHASGGDEDNNRPRILLITPGGTRATGGYLKIGDIKGESTNAEKKGNVEYSWKIEEGESALPPSPGIQIRPNQTDPAAPKLLQASCGGANAVCNPNDADTPDRLREFIERTANTLPQIREINVSDDAIAMRGVQPFKLFGFIPLHITTTIETSMNPDAFARVKVRLPWYRIFGRVAKADQTAVEVEQALAQLEIPVEPTQLDLAAGTELQADSVPTEQISLNFEKIKAHVVGAMAKLIAQYNETDLDFLSR